MTNLYNTHPKKHGVASRPWCAIIFLTSFSGTMRGFGLSRRLVRAWRLANTKP
jgi:hypothetical protein